MKYFPILEMLEEIQALVVERVAGNSFQDLYGLRASCKLMKALADRRRVCHFYDVLSVPWGLNMPAELLKTCYAERNPSTLYIKGVRFVFTLNLEEEGVSLMKLAADAGYERDVYTHTMTRKIFWDGDEGAWNSKEVRRGAATVVLMSNTSRNPGRWFYRCGAISGENHVFKWLDEAHDEEFVVVANKLATMEQDLADIKADLADMKNDINEIVALIECLRVKC
ncbi:hypothetical protein Bca52824_075790 [Brassica carinata]|uniref:F-box domain-containing protein n=1 Tax=Brassica carinata TaxID=52824 RepID=A0A8X7PR13_BRACI|nr:hypothetical protein Bca52824_075790 [Brassica carinata]